MRTWGMIAGILLAVSCWPGSAQTVAPAATNGPAAAKSKLIAGTYNLAAVNGKLVPATVAHEGANLQIQSGSFTITADGNCISKMTFVPPTGKEATVETRATYTLQGRELNELKMQWQGAGQTTGSVHSNTFTMENEGMILTYKK